MWHEDDPQRKNTYVYFRRVFDLDAVDASAGFLRRSYAGERVGEKSSPTHSGSVIHITADTEYMLWVNAAEVGRGPVLSDPRWQPYDTYDLAPFLQAGENVIAVLCYWYGEGLEDDSWRRYPTRPPLNMKRAAHDSRPGLLCQAELNVGGETARIVSDGSWRSKVADAWMCDVAKIDDMTYSEVYSAQSEPLGWQQTGFDDSAWDGVKVLGSTFIYPWIILEPRDLPYMAHKELLPAEVVSTGEIIERDYLPGAPALQMALEQILPSEFTAITDPQSLVSGGCAEIEPFDQNVSYEEFQGVRSATIILDMGELLNGRVYIDVEGSKHGRIDIAYGQRLLEDGKPEIYSSRICAADTYTMREGRQQWTSFGWRHFRYVQLTFRSLDAPLTIHGIKAVADEYAAEEIGAFECSDETLNWLWKAGVKTSRLCTYDRLMDCANRERRQHSMGGMAMGILTAFGDTPIVRRFFRTFMRGQTPYGCIPNASPSEYEHSPIIGGSSSLTSAIWKHYLLYGDKELLADGYEMLDRYMRLLENYRSDDGLICDHPFVVFQDDPEVDGAGKGKVLVVNAFYACDLEVANWMATELGHTEAASRYARQFKDTRDAINTKFWDDKRGVLVDYITPDDFQGEHVSEHGNYIMLCYGYMSQDRAARMIGFLKDAGSTVGMMSPAYFPWALEGFFRYGFASEILEIARERYGWFIRDGQSTLGELWNIHGMRSYGNAWQAFGSRALAHGEPSAAIYCLASDVLGVRPLTPGSAEIEIAPKPGDLAWAKGAVPTGKGLVNVEWRIADGKFKLDCDLPDGVRAKVTLPTGKADAEWVTEKARVEGEY